MLELLEDYLKMLGSLFCSQVENHRHWKALQGIVHLLDPTPWSKSADPTRFPKHDFQALAFLQIHSNSRSGLEQFPPTCQGTL